MSRAIGSLQGLGRHLPFRPGAVHLQVQPSGRLTRWVLCTVCLSVILLVTGQWPSASAQQAMPALLPQPMVQPTLPPRPTLQPTLPPRPTLEPTLPPRPTLEPTLPPRPTIAPTLPARPTLLPTESPDEHPREIATPSSTPTPQLLPASGSPRSLNIIPIGTGTLLVVIASLVFLFSKPKAEA
jgi:hypothetical protein